MIRVLINKFTFMKDSKQSFKDLVKKMDSLEETQQGKLKGGFSTMSAATLFGYSPFPRESLRVVLQFKILKNTNIV